VAASIGVGTSLTLDPTYALSKDRPRMPRWPAVPSGRWRLRHFGLS
jgi:hypothetical protein